VSSPEETREKYTLIKRPGKSRYEVAPGMQVAVSADAVSRYFFVCASFFSMETEVLTLIASVYNSAPEGSLPVSLDKKRDVVHFDLRLLRSSFVKISLISGCEPLR
jgi:hypothetical protein